MRLLRTGAMVAVVAAACVVGATPSSGLPDGAVRGREHEVRIRPILGEIPAQRGKVRPRDRVAADAAVLSCDPAAVGALDRVPTTSRDGDDPGVCVVVGRTDQRRPARLLLGPAVLSGGDLARASADRDGAGNDRIRVRLAERGRARWTFVADQVAGAPLAFTLDGVVIGVAPVTTTGSYSATITLVPRLGFDDSDDLSVAQRIDQARSEEVIELGRLAAMNARGRTTFAEAQPRIIERTSFTGDCPFDEATSSVVLGCYDGAHIFLLRVDRADLTGVMTVTAAHEMLHAAYAGLGPDERRRVDRLVDEYLETPDPRVAEALAEYEDIEGSDLADEAHSLVATLVRTLPPALERYYGTYFADRGAVVDAFEGYRHVFDDLQATYDRLAAEVDALAGELGAVEAQLESAGAEADRLFREIESLRAQGRVEESNGLVGAQNAAASRANGLASRYNSLVATYNAKVDELNNAAFAVNSAYESLTPIDTDAP